MPKTLLLADDSPTIRRIVELTFSETEVRVEAVGSGSEAVELLAQLEPDLVLADVVMPEPSGYELCRRVKSAHPGVPVLLLTGTFENFDEQLARECGADDHLVKPFESTALQTKVEELLSRPTATAPAPVLDPQPSSEEPTSPTVEVEVRHAPEPPEQAAQEAHEAEQTEQTEEIAEQDGNWTEIRLDPQDVQDVAREVIRQMSDKVVREIAEQLVPELAARIVRERIRELENEDG